MRVAEIRQKIDEFVKKRDELDGVRVEKSLNVHYWCRDRLLCSTHVALPQTTTNMDEVTCYWCRGRLKKRYHE